MAASDRARDLDEDLGPLVRRERLPHRRLRRVDGAPRLVRARLRDAADDVARVRGVDVDPLAGLDPLAGEKQLSLDCRDRHSSKPMQPETRYARSGDVNIAYQVVGEGPLDLVYVPGWVSNVELNWAEPLHARFLGRLASFSRLIIFDKRGTGLSDRVPADQLPDLEQRMDDVRAVLDAVGSERAALFGFSEGGNMSVLFAATYPGRTVALVVFGHLRQAPLDSRVPVGADARAARARDRGRRARLARLRRFGTLSERRRAVREALRRLREDEREPGRGRGAAADEHADRRPRGAAGDPRADARHPPDGRPRRKRGGRSVDRRPDPGREVRRDRRAGPPAVRRRSGRSARRDRGVPDRYPPRAGPRPGAGHRSLHRHRRLDRARGRSRRPPLARAPRHAQRRGPRRARALRRPRGRHRR